MLRSFNRRVNIINWKFARGWACQPIWIELYIYCIVGRISIEKMRFCFYQRFLITPIHLLSPDKWPIDNRQLWPSRTFLRDEGNFMPSSVLARQLQFKFHTSLRKASKEVLLIHFRYMYKIMFMKAIWSDGKNGSFVLWYSMLTPTFIIYL